MAAKTIIITGASDGIGAAAARQLAADGHTVVVVGRSAQKTTAIAEELGAPYFLADFTRLSDVRGLANSLAETYPRIDVLANNAGGIFGSRERTSDGFEKTLQVNHLAPFLLTNLLMETLTASDATVITTSSAGARLWGNIDLADLSNDKNYSANKAYGDAKLANILFTHELDRRFSDQGVSAAAFHPGIVATGFASDTTSLMRFVYQSPLKRLMGLISPEKGAEGLVWLAEGAPGTDWVSGAYYEKQKVAKTSEQAYDDRLAERFWDLSAEMVGLASLTSN